MRLFIRALVVCIPLAFSSAQDAMPTRYTATNLGAVFEEEAVTSATGLSNEGHVAGQGNAPADAPQGIYAFVWLEDRMVQVQQDAEVPVWLSSRGRDVNGEGAVVLVLESLKHARLRDATPIAEIRSYAATSDARHLTAPDENGTGATRCMLRALTKACFTPQHVDYINAHGTGTPVGDPIEATAIKAAFGDHAASTAVSSTKSSTGHLLGAAGALAVGVTSMALREGVLPPTINLDRPDPDCDLLHVPNVAVQRDVRVALVPSYGFGGHNGCVVLEKWSE